jgi:phosphoribosylamine--glycine ligase
MRILVIGSGAREHALIWKLTGERYVREIFCAPGNAGTGRICSNVAIPADDVEWLAQWAAESAIDLTVVGPEVPLAAGVVDRFRERALRIAGPTAAAARIESSAVFARELMARHGIPTVPFDVFDDAAAAQRHVRDRPESDFPLVITADGPGAEQSVVTTHSLAADALTALANHPGRSGARIVIEQLQQGTAISIGALFDGTTMLLMPAVRDYERLGAGDTGPATGGMGACSPPRIATDELVETVRDRILEPAVGALEKEGAPFRGFLCADLVVTERGPMVLGFKAHLGDPEAQCILPRLRSDLMPLLFSLAEGTLAEEKPVWRSEACCATVVARAAIRARSRRDTASSGLTSWRRISWSSTTPRAIPISRRPIL